MGQNFQDSKRYASLYSSPKGPGDARPTAFQIIKDNDVIGKWEDKVILVTGGSNGLGVEEVKNFARTGAKVFFTSRDLVKGQGVRDDVLKELREEGLVQDPKVEVIRIDLESLDSIRKGAEDFRAKSDKLNILVNNAGVANTPRRIVAGFEWQFLVNHLAHFYLFHLLKDLLLKSSTPSFNSRVVAVSSLAHTMAPMQLGDYNLEKRGYEPFVAYAQSKTANIWFANELDRRYGGHGLHGISVHPGGIMTGLQRFHDEKAAAMLDQFLEMPHIKATIMNVEQGAATVVLAAVGKEYESVGGFYMEDGGVSEPVKDDALIGSPGHRPWAYDEEGEKQLWLDSLEMLKLKDE